MKIVIDAKHLNLYRLVPLAVMLWPTGNAIADLALSPISLSTTAAARQTSAAAASELVNEGDTIAGYPVTSGYDLQRIHPVDGDIRPHYGVDLATPTRTPLIAPETLKVDCWWDANGGGLVADIKPATGDEVKALHLDYCTPGSYSAGDTFALTGATGKGTGAHLDIRRNDKAPPTVADVEPYLTGQLPDVTPNVPDTIALPNTSTIADGELSDRELTCAIGAAEGTRDRNCDPTEAYTSHTDPGNGARNQGSFSYQHGADSPEHADQLQRARLRHAEAGFHNRSRERFGRRLSKPALAAALDLWNQSPKAGEDFINHLPSATPTAEQIIEARSKSYVDPSTGRLDAPGLGNNAAQVEADQTRRTAEVLDQLERAQNR